MLTFNKKLTPYLIPHNCREVKMSEKINPENMIVYGLQEHHSGYGGNRSSYSIEMCLSRGISLI
jgi:hypothetical protein